MNAAYSHLVIPVIQEFYWSIIHLLFIGVSLVAQLVKNLPTMQETPVWFPSQEDPLEKG